MAPLPAYRFGSFLVSRRRRQLLRAGAVVPLIPKYFDLLVLLIERRPAVVTRREIFDVVWGDVIVSDGALTQAIRTLRRVLGDDSREPTFIRTASRHGYSFVFAEVEEADVEEAPTSAEDAARARSRESGLETLSAEARVAALAESLCSLPESPDTIEERRDLAGQLLVIDPAGAVRAVTARPRHAAALALLREARWDVPGAGPVPLLGRPEGVAAAWWLVRWRTREALRITARRWVQAAGGASVAGLAAGLLGGGLLVAAPGSTTPLTAIPVLMLLGGMAGFIAASGVAAGIATAEAVSRSGRFAAVVVGGALGGAAIGTLLQVLGSWTLANVFGLAVAVGGSVEGACLGGAVALGYALTTARRGGGIAAPTGGARWLAALTAGLATAATAVALAASGYPLVGGIIHAIAEASRGSQMQLTPLGAWLGEPAFGPVTQALVAAAEGALFGFGLTWGLTRRAGRL